jgi:hypothetical protein
LRARPPGNIDAGKAEGIDMHPNGIRRCIGTGCFVMLLMPAGAAPARVLAEARVDACAPVGIVRAGAFEGARMLGEAPRAGAPWFRRTFVEIQADGTCGLKPIAKAARSGRGAVVESAAIEAQQPPGVVRNVRRTDRR